MSEDATNPMLPGTGRNESLQRAFDLLELLAQKSEGASVATISLESGLPRSTVSRLLASLFDAGAVARPGADRKWVVGPTITRLTNAVAPLVSLQGRSRPVLEEITERIGETSMLAVPTGPATARILDEVQGPKLVGVRYPWAGQTIDSPASGFVRQLLAELPGSESDRLIDRMELVRHTPKTKVTKEELRAAVEEIREQQHSSIIDELEDGLSGIGVPVRKEGQLIALLATYMPTVRLTPEVYEDALNALRAGAERLC
jgi:IclR family acetate operon transcriptional repressor